METTGHFKRIVTSEHAVREVLGHPSDTARLKQLSALDEHCRAFIAQSPFLLMGTSNAAGHCDVSPKGDPPGFVLVLDDRHLAIPDRPGNKRLDGMRNILENPHVALIFFVPGRGDTLRVNGRAWIVRDDDLLERLAVNGTTPRFAIGVEVEEAFLHCPKAFMRSRLWDPASQERPTALPSMGRMLWDQTGTKPPAGSVEEYERDLNRRLQKLY